jgi:hypothetical protein
VHLVQLSVADVEVNPDNAATFTILSLQGVDYRPVVISID